MPFDFLIRRRRELDHRAPGRRGVVIRALSRVMHDVERRYSAPENGATETDPDSDPLGDATTMDSPPSRR